MIGFHYTSFDNWLNIQKNGMKPYPIRNVDFTEFFGVKRKKGIWVWEEPQEGLAHFGSVIYQVSSKASLKIVRLALEYDFDRDVLKSPWSDEQSFLLSHTGNIGNLDYHDGTQKARLLVNPVPTEKIWLVDEYDLLELLAPKVKINEKQRETIFKEERAFRQVAISC